MYKPLGKRSAHLFVFAVVGITMSLAAFGISWNLERSRAEGQFRQVADQRLQAVRNRAYEIVERLAQRAGLPMPKIYVIPTDSPNAFATGRNPSHASVAMTEGILNLLNDEELEGVLAHELGHVRNRDILIGSVAATLAGAVTFLARMAWWAGMFGGYGNDREERRGGGLGGILMMVLAPIAAMLIQMAISRSREYQADATGAHFTGNPYALANALRKLDACSQRRPLLASPSTAHLFIVQPLVGMDFASLFSTHPPIAKRIERLTGRPQEIA